ncbi:hypothetical protein PDM28_11325 [Stenotrophomonas aracearum]|jgi:hypothetical protein|uniref:DUF421 domain-containing protein n=1 Tax=Stenotrophomonas aracearum TaxID=3003272 RepID=A0ABY9Y8U5_9GAMM|nr:hypothetical protein [Stenotrophomonas sp. A5588]WNH47291.1 hypothetical protein PDM28_11325 [Stenotrophomonas sp. A5588]
MAGFEVAGLVEALKKLGMTRVALVIVVAAALTSLMGDALLRTLPALLDWFGKTGVMVLAAAVAWLVISLVERLLSATYPWMEHRAEQKILARLIEQLSEQQKMILRAAVDGRFEHLDLHAVQQSAQRQGQSLSVEINGLRATRVIDYEGLISAPVYRYLLANPASVGSKAPAQTVREGW